MVDSEIWADYLSTCTFSVVHVPKEPPTNATEVAYFKSHYWPCALPPKLIRPPYPPLMSAQADFLTACIRFLLAQERASTKQMPICCALLPTDAEGQLLLSDTIEENTFRVLSWDARELLSADQASTCASSVQSLCPAKGEVLGHATMKALAALAASPDVPDKYLATRHVALLTHEPCVMCTMALVHSRIVAVYYCHPDSVGGGCTRYYLHENKEINHRFPVMQYIP